jgi:benzoylformate decarboxylase
MGVPPDAEARRKAVIEARRVAWAAEGQKLESVPSTPGCMSPADMMRTLVEVLPQGALVYDEALTSTGALQHYLRPDRLGDYILGRGGCIGVGWPGAVGAAVAEPGRMVVAPSGDGCAMFALQTLWTAVNERLNVKFIVCNNGAYRILKINLMNYQKGAGETPGKFPFMDIDPPRLDFVKMAQGMGMQAARADTPSELRAALQAAFAHDGPALVDVHINGSIEQEKKDIFGQ